MNSTIGTTPVEYLRKYQSTMEPKLGFRATNAKDLETWKAALREKLRDLLGFDAMKAWQCDLLPREDESEDRGGYTMQRVTIQTAPGFRIPLLVLRPKTGNRFKSVLALHGHGYGKRDVCGIADNASERVWQDHVNYRYAIDAVERGYIVFAPDKRAFGELMEARDARSDRQTDNYRSCEWHTMSAILLGMTQIGLHVWDNQRVLDYIDQRQDCLRGSVAALGVSGGGQASLWLGALDERVKVAVISGHLGSFGKSILLTDGCTCNTVPQLLLWAEKSDVAGLIAPRPLLLESGSDDEWYSRESQLECYREIQRIYRVAGASDRIDIDLFKGYHRWSGRKAWDWLATWLT